VLSQNEAEDHSVNERLSLPFPSTEQLDFLLWTAGWQQIIDIFLLFVVGACQCMSVHQDGCHSPRHVRRNGEILDADTGSDSILETIFRERINPSFRCQDLAPLMCFD